MARLIELAPASQVHAPQIPRRTLGDEPPLSRVPDPLTKPLDSLSRRRDDKVAALLKLTRRPRDPKRIAV